MFGAEILADLDLAGARNVFIAIGQGRLHFYDQPPRDEGRGAIHHLGIQTDDLEALVAHLKAKGFLFRKAISEKSPSVSLRAGLRFNPALLDKNLGF